jgi:hypothetical protein
MINKNAERRKELRRLLFGARKKAADSCGDRRRILRPGVGENIRTRPEKRGMPEAFHGRMPGNLPSVNHSVSMITFRPSQ